MTFWTYMLHCRGGSYYTGHTDDLDRRIAQHESGHIPGFTAGLLPVKLVWSEGFSTRAEALAAEHRIKGWSRAKKMALIRGDWRSISRLAKKQNGPSTSSGRTGKEGRESRAAFRHALTPHPTTRSGNVDTVFTSFTRSGVSLWIEYKVIGGSVRTSPPSDPARTNGLWRTTCFELFVRPAGSDAYCEFNFSPSTQWAAYRFERYREGMIDWRVAAPRIEPIENGVRVLCDLGDIGAAALKLGLSAVIEEIDGTKSYWALAHPPGAPDFHHPDCFALELPSQDAA